MIGPSIAEERAAALHSIVKAAPMPSWKSHGLVARVVFFCFTIFAAEAFGLLLYLLRLPKYVVGAVICLVTAEVLIQRKRFFGTGIEAALWTAGLVNLILLLPHSGRVEAILVFALAAAIVGWRVRSAIFGSVAAILVVVYCGAKGESWHWAPIVAAIVIAVGAALARMREWQRPSTEELFGLVAVSAPVAGYFAAQIGNTDGPSLGFAAAFALLAVVLFAIGITRRDRVINIAAAVSVALAATEARELLTTPIEVKLIFAGALLVAIAVALSRALRARTSGFVVTPSQTTKFDDAMQIIGTVAAAHPVSSSSAPPQRESGGGSFGGAGASGDF